MAQALRQRMAPFLIRAPNRVAGSNSPGFRSMSSSAHNEDVEETMKWRKITIGAYISCICLGTYTLVGGGHHEEHERPAYSYMHIRNKEFPWGPDGLFERKHDH